MALIDYGPLTDLVKYAGILISSAGAIGLTWRRRANWEPSEQDVPKGPARLAGLLTAVSIGIMWTQYSKAEFKAPLVMFAVSMSMGALVFLLLYGYVVARFVFEQKISPKGSHAPPVKIIGGFGLTSGAKKQIRSAGSIQKLFEAAAFDPDLIWPRESRALAKQLFALCFIGLHVCGSLALSSAALLFLLGRGGSDRPLAP